MVNVLNRGSNISFQQANLPSTVVVTLVWDTTPGIDADLSAFLCTPSGKVRDDNDFVFFNQPEDPDHTVKHLGKTTRNNQTIDQIKIDTQNLPSEIEKIVIGSSLDGGTFGQLENLGVEVSANQNEQPSVRAELSANDETGLVFAEIYKRNSEWKIRVVGQGFTNGLSGLATSHGVDVDEEEPSTENKTPATQTPSTPLNLEKKRLIDLEKTISKDPAMISLVKTAGVSLQKKGLSEHTARVALVLDISLSMTELYRSGAVQRLAERVLALGLRFDDDGAVDVFLFGGNVHIPEPLKFNGYQQYVHNITNQYQLEGYTKYGAAISAVRKHYLGSSANRNEPVAEELPIYVMFITDGAPTDQANATKQIKAASYEPIFWQFMGIGPESRFNYLKKLDSEIPGRYVDNANFFSVTEDELLGRKPISDDKLYEDMMSEYPQWVKDAPKARLLK